MGECEGGYNNNIPNVIPQVRFEMVRLYADLHLPFGGSEYKSE